DLFRARVQDFLRVRHGANAARDTERNVQNARYPAHPLAIDTAAFGARADVIEDELVRALVAIARRELHDAAHDPVVANAHAFHDLAGAHVEAGDDASGKSGAHAACADR